MNIWFVGKLCSRSKVYAMSKDGESLLKFQSYCKCHSLSVPYTFLFPFIYVYCPCMNLSLTTIKLAVLSTSIVRA